MTQPRKYQQWKNREDDSIAVIESARGAVIEFRIIGEQLNRKWSRDLFTANWEVL